MVHLQRDEQTRERETTRKSGEKDKRTSQDRDRKEGGRTGRGVVRIGEERSRRREEKKSGEPSNATISGETRDDVTLSEEPHSAPLSQSPLCLCLIPCSFFSSLQHQLASLLHSTPATPGAGDETVQVTNAPLSSRLTVFETPCRRRGRSGVYRGRPGRPRQARTVLQTVTPRNMTSRRDIE